MGERTISILMWSGCFAAILLITYGFALLGEPRSVWLMRDVFGVLSHDGGL